MSDQATRLLGMLLQEAGAQRALEEGSGICARHTVLAATLLGPDSREAECLLSCMRVKFGAMRTSMIRVEWALPVLKVLMSFGPRFCARARIS